jgi:hypothetical protein
VELLRARSFALHVAAAAAATTATAVKPRAHANACFAHASSRVAAYRGFDSPDDDDDDDDEDDDDDDARARFLIDGHSRRAISRPRIGDSAKLSSIDEAFFVVNAVKICHRDFMQLHSRNVLIIP